MDATYQEIVLMVEQAATASMRDFCFAAPSELVTELGLHMLDIGSVVATRSAHWHTLHINRVFGLGVKEAASEAILDDLTTFYRAVGVQFAVGLSPLARPTALAQWLAARGFVHFSNTTILHRGVEPPEAQTALRIERIDATYAATFAAILVEASPLPEFFAPWLIATVGRPGRQHYVAFDGTTPVAALGCTLVISDTEEDTPENPSWSCRNLQKAGFQITYLRPDYKSPPFE